jgi:hypothetical protein
MNAVDAWIDAIPDNWYDPCPCGCGKKFRFVMRPDLLEEHEHRFCNKLAPLAQREPDNCRSAMREDLAGSSYFSTTNM